MKAPKVSIVCVGTFHHFDLARQLFQRNMLERIFTGYPRWKLKSEQLPRQMVTTFPWLQVPYILLSRWGILNDGLKKDVAWWAHKTLDDFVTAVLPDSDILFALSSSGLKSGIQMQNRGGKFVCDRGSSHIRFQDSILREEYARWNVFSSGVEPRMIERDEAGYEVADIITIPSSFAFRTFIDAGIPEEKLRKVPYGVDIGRYKKIADPRTGSFDVLFVGQVSFRKGIPYLLEAFRLLRHPHKRLRIVGAIQPEIEPYLASQELPDQVEFLKPVPRDDLQDLMSRAHVMVIPSIEEGLALVQGIALACGCPVIGTTNSGAEDLYTDGKEGFIVPIRDARIIADKMQELADDSGKRQSMSEAALKRVETLGGWETYGAMMAKVLTDLCSD